MALGVGYAGRLISRGDGDTLNGVDFRTFRRLVRKYRGLATRDVDAVLALLDATELVELGAIPSVSRDPKDDPILETARVGNASYDVSEDDDLLVLGEYEGIRIVDAATFLAILSERDEARGRDGA